MTPFWFINIYARLEPRAALTNVDEAIFGYSLHNDMKKMIKNIWYLFTCQRDFYKH